MFQMQQTEEIGSQTPRPLPAIRPRLLGSVVVPAHNEAGVIQRCLDGLFDGIQSDEIDVTVVCNGCSDATADVTRAHPSRVRVIELTEASKAAALRAGDAAALAFPRLYLDADVVLAGSSAKGVLAHLAAGAVAARPPLRYDTSRSSALVRRYFRARSSMPAVLGSLWGAGVYGLSSAGRARFGAFPDLGADDLWLDRQFAPSEIEIVDCAPVTVIAPRRSSDLLRTLRRTYHGKDETGGTMRSDRRARRITVRAVHDLLTLLSRGPQSGTDAVVYAGFAIAARVRAALVQMGRGASPRVWERDDSSREVVAG
jgi:glycosyltransferase involved in cell wall biosynthesis